MPKAVDIYVLQKKIGSGQFGDVYKGYSKVDGIDVAIKTIKRDKVKGKFTQLLENEIQVLKSCKNNNIIQLIDIKKTVNNIYLVLEYCNEGDLGAALKQRKKFTQEEAVQYLVQILHGFQTLVKNKIMHRDFKLPNVLKSDGIIKIADFGFAKLLGTEDQQVQTILGSPLNMAPQVLNHQTYNSKADIWSIGVAFYEMVFGKVPYTASNIVDLLKKIRNDPIIFPHKVTPAIEDAIRKMLTVDPTKRIEWNDLFKHPVTRLRQEKLQDGLKRSMLCDRKELSFNMSKFYIKANMVVDNTKEINEKSEFNNYLKEIMKNQKCGQYNGKLIKRETERAVRDIKNEAKFVTQKDIKDNDQEQYTEAQINKGTIKQNLTKLNAARLLHQRNVYAYLGHLAEDLLELNKNIYSECLAFLLVKKVMQHISILKYQMKTHTHNGILNWQQFEKTPQFASISAFVASQQQIFSRFYQKLSIKVLQKGTLQSFEDDLMISGKFTKQETNRRMYHRVIGQYLKRIQENGNKVTTREWIHIGKLLDSQDMGEFSNSDFDFHEYYSSYDPQSNPEIQDICRKKYSTFLKKQF